MKDFRKKIENLINIYSLENGSDTPDFILAQYLVDCLKSFDKALQSREDWYCKGIGVKQELTKELFGENGDKV